MNEVLKNGFLGYDASLMLDVVVTALVLIVPWLLYSLYLVKVKRNYLLHKKHQLAIFFVLIFAVGAFELDMQMHGGGLAIVNKVGEPTRLDGEQLAFVRQMLRVHLVFAISTPLLWIATVVNALLKFPNPPVPGPNSRLHKVLGWASVIDLVGTSVTGLLFYYQAFVVTG